MATAAVSTTLVNGTANSATPVNGNFTDLVTFLNGSVIHRDGTKTMTAALDLNSQKITNLANGVNPGDAVNKAQLDAGASTVAWISGSPLFVNSWTNQGLGNQDFQYRKIGDIVYIRGDISNGSVSTIGTLPSGYRPPAQFYAATPTSGQIGVLSVTSAGVLSISAANATVWTHLDCSFSVTA